jgi:hypothetical protein
VSLETRVGVDEDGNPTCPGTDTVIELYDGDVLVDDNDDGGNRFCSLLELDLESGDYVLKVTDLGNNSAIDAYELAVNIQLVDLGRAPEPGDLVITEIMQNPGAVLDADGEWLEVYVAADESLHIGDIRLSDNNGNFVIPNGSAAEPGDYIVFARSEAALGDGAEPDFVYGNRLQLANDGDSVVLSLGAVELDRVDYSEDDGFPDPNGSSMQLDSTEAPGDTDNADASNWCEAPEPFGTGDNGSPGAANPPCPQLEPFTTEEVQEVLNANCTPCHIGGFTFPDLSNVANVGPRHITGGDGDSSLLVQRMRGEGGRQRMPRGRDALPAETISRIALWIDGLPID